MSESLDEQHVNRFVQRAQQDWNQLIPDGAARTIAAWWQSPGERDRPLAALATTGAITKDEAVDRIEFLIQWEADRQQRSQLRALLAYVTDHGDRSPVDGWADRWATNEPIPEE